MLVVAGPAGGHSVRGSRLCWPHFFVTSSLRQLQSQSSMDQKPINFPRAVKLKCLLLIVLLTTQVIKSWSESSWSPSPVSNGIVSIFAVYDDEMMSRAVHRSQDSCSTTNNRVTHNTQLTTQQQMSGHQINHCRSGGRH